MRTVHILKSAGLAGAVALAAVGTADAQVIRCESFPYADGSLVGNDNWANHSGTAGDLLVSSGQAVVQHGAPSEDANVSFTSKTSGDMYYALDFSVDDLGAPYNAGGDYEYFVHFKDDTTSNFSARVDIVPPSGGGDYSVGIASDESTADATWPSDLTYGTTYRAVVRFDQGANIAELWIDPTVSTDPSILGEDRADPGDTVTAVALRQSDSSENETVRVDNLMIGMTFDDVVGISATCGTQTVRISTSPNTGVLTRGRAPYIGGFWNPSITTLTGPPASLDVLVVTLGALDFPVWTGNGFGSLLCNISPPAFTQTVTSGTAFSFKIPNKPVLIGAGFCTQAAGISAGPAFELTNALDIVIGG